MIKQEIFDIEPAETAPRYWEKGGSYKGKDPRNHYKVDIENKGLTCSDCKFNCTLEKALIYFSKHAYQGVWRPDLRSGYNAECKKCASKRSHRYKLKKNLAINPDWKPHVVHFYDEINAECTRCRKIKPHSDFAKSGVRTSRPVVPTCKPCSSDIGFENRRRDIKLTKYKGYRSVMRSEGNDCDMTYEEFLERWPRDNKCPILGHKLKIYPKEERGKWQGGRHYPNTPCIDHIDPRKKLSKDNLQIICWRANELKGDAIPVEIHLLSIYMKDVFAVGNGVFEDIGYKNTLRESGWVGKYANMD